MKHVCLFLLCLCIAIAGTGQIKQYSEKEYAKAPLWISLIKDTTTNFFTAERAYNVYFEHHSKPSGENEEIGERSKKGKSPTKQELKKMQRDNQMRIEIRKYEHWVTMMRPFVQPDGSILTPSQRLQIWKNQKTNH